MGMNLGSRRNGISLVDLVIGMALLVVVLLGAFLSLRALTQGRGGISVNARVNNKLRTIAEQMRYDGGTDTYFSWDQNPTHDWTSSFDPSIQVNSVVSTEDSATRSRKVTLTANWNDISGKPQTRTMTFYVNRVRAESPGTTVSVHIVKQGFPDQGIGGVLVWVQGKNGPVPPTGAPTGSDGRVLLHDALIGSHIKVTIDGQYARAFFNNEGTYVANDYSQHVWTKDFYLTETSLSQTNHELDDPNPVVMVPPAELYGTVTDLSVAGSPTTAPSGLTIYADPIGAPDISVNPNIPLIISTSTESNGTYRIVKLVPGTYQPESLGSKLYAAQVNPGDYFTTNNPEVIRLNPNDSRRVDFRTAKKGSLTGSVVKVMWDGSNFSSNGAAPSSIGLTFTHNNTAGYFDPSVMPPTTPFNFYYTEAWYRHFSTTYATTQSNTVTGGTYSDPALSPMMIHQDTADFAADGQCSIVNVEPANYLMPSDVTPIRIRSTTGAFPASPGNVQEYLVSKWWGTLTAPSGTSASLFNDAEVKVNQTANKTIYLADRSTLGRVSGTIMMGTSTFSTANNARIWVNFAGNHNGFGGLMFDNNDPNQAYLGFYQKNLSAGVSTFDTDYNVAGLHNNIPLTLGSDTMKIFFDCGNTVSISRIFTGSVVTTQKTINSAGDEQWTVVNPSDVNTTMYVYGYEFYPNANPALPGSRGNQIFASPVPIAGGNLGSGGGGFTQILTSQNRWAGNTAEFQLSPGAYTGNWKTDAVINVSQTQFANFASSFSLCFQPDITSGYAYSIGDSQHFMTNRVFNSQPLGAVYTYNGTNYVQNTTDYGAWNTVPLSLWRRIKVHVFGTVTGTVPPSSTVVPIPGAPVNFKDRDGNTAATTTNASGYYSFPVRYVTPNPGWNIGVQVGDITVGTMNYSHTAYINRPIYDPNGGQLDVQQDFTIPGTQIVSSGGGGPGDQGGN